MAKSVVVELGWAAAVIVAGCLQGIRGTLE